MESSGSYMRKDCSAAGEQRAGKIRTRAQTKKLRQEEEKRELAKEGLTQNEYWIKFVKSEADIVRFYEIYYPQYPDCIAKSIAARVAQIIAKSQSGQKLTDDEAAYYTRSIVPNPSWDPMEELKEQKMQGQIHLAAKKMTELLTE